MSTYTHEGRTVGDRDVITCPRGHEHELTLLDEAAQELRLEAARRLIAGIGLPESIVPTQVPVFLDERLPESVDEDGIYFTCYAYDRGELCDSRMTVVEHG